MKNAPRDPEARALALFRNYNPFHSIIHYYVDLSCFLVFKTTPRNWWALNRRKRVTSFFGLEVKYRSTEVRDRVLSAGFSRSEKNHQTVVVERLGFKDFFVPILYSGKILGHLQAGAFRDSELTLGEVEDCWRKMAGREPSPALPEFREFVRALLEIPVLDAPLFQAFQESLELYAKLLADSPPEPIGERLHTLLVEVFSKHLPASYWMDWALGRPTFESTPAWTRRMEKWTWTREEIGLERIPTTVMVVVPRAPVGTDSHWAAEMLRTYRFQRRCFSFARTLSQTVGGKLDDYGAAFVTSADRSLGRLAQRRQIDATSRKIREFAEKELGLPVLMGVGKTVKPGESLNDSYRQAVLALHMRRDPGKSILYFNEREKEDLTEGYSQQRRALDALNEAFASGPLPGLETLKERFLRLSLNLSFQNPHEIRWHFRYALDRLAETVCGRLGLGREESVPFRENLGGVLEEGANIQEIVTAFKEGLARLEGMQVRPSSLKRNLSREKVREHIDRRYTEPLRIVALAEMAGVSVSTFGREFKRLTGMGLEDYLQKRRVEKAKQLLEGTNLPVSRIARDCGFRSDSYFNRLFRAKTGWPPQRYRIQSRKL